MTESKMDITKGVHYKDYIQSAENLSVKKVSQEVFEFRVCEWKTYPIEVLEYYKPFYISPNTDLSAIPQNILQQLDEQMYYCGESDDEEIRQAKFSETRKNIQSHLNRI